MRVQFVAVFVGLGWAAASAGPADISHSGPPPISDSNEPGIKIVVTAGDVGRDSEGRPVPPGRPPRTAATPHLNTPGHPLTAADQASTSPAHPPAASYFTPPGHPTAKCCPPGSVLYLGHGGAGPSCELLALHPGPQLARLRTGAGARAGWVVAQHGSPPCSRSELLVTRNHAVEKEVPHCQDWAVRDGQDMELVRQVCVEATRHCSQHGCVAVCPGYTGGETGDVVVVMASLQCSEFEEVKVTMRNSSVWYLDRQLGLGSYCMLDLARGLGQVCREVSRADQNPLPPFKLTLMKYLYLVSVVCLLLTLLLHLLVSERRASLFGWMKIAQLTALLLTFLFMSITTFGGLALILDWGPLCTAIGFAKHFFFLSRFGITYYIMLS